MASILGKAARAQNASGPYSWISQNGRSIGAARPVPRLSSSLRRQSCSEPVDSEKTRPSSHPGMSMMQCQVRLERRCPGCIWGVRCRAPGGEGRAWIEPYDPQPSQFKDTQGRQGRSAHTELAWDESGLSPLRVSVRLAAMGDSAPGRGNKPDPNRRPSLQKRRSCPRNRRVSQRVQSLSRSVKLPVHGCGMVHPRRLSLPSRTDAFANCAPSGQPGRGSFREKVMLGLIMMCVPLCIAIGLSTLALARSEPDHSVGRDAEDGLPRKIKDVPCKRSSSLSRQASS